MNNKIIVVICICLIVICAVLFIHDKDTTFNPEEMDSSGAVNIVSNNNIQIKENSDGLYEIYDEVTNEIITTVEDSAELKKYQENPQYDEFAPTIQ